VITSANPIVPSFSLTDLLIDCTNYTKRDSATKLTNKVQLTHEKECCSNCFLSTSDIWPI